MTATFARQVLNFAFEVADCATHNDLKNYGR